jgi:predicted rRNA methylase YqxC with S4 and FtsJ domains
MERTNAIHAELPELVSLVTIDVAWTKQRIILPAAQRMLEPAGDVITLIKPHYEADASMLRKGVLPAAHVDEVVRHVERDVLAAGFELIRKTLSPLRGAGGNAELLAWLRPARID